MIQSVERTLHRVGGVLSVGVSGVRLGAQVAAEWGGGGASGTTCSSKLGAAL